MAHVLIIIITLGDPSTGVATVEFASKDACEVAAKSIKDFSPSTVFARCFPKGTPAR